MTLKCQVIETWPSPGWADRARQRALEVSWHLPPCCLGSFRHRLWPQTLAALCFPSPAPSSWTIKTRRNTSLLWWLYFQSKWEIRLLRRLVRFTFICCTGSLGSCSLGHFKVLLFWKIGQKFSWCTSTQLGCFSRADLLQLRIWPHIIWLFFKLKVYNAAKYKTGRQRSVGE